MTEKKPNTKRPDPNKVQRQASDPNSSVWVSASAGTGKTKVLTDRCLRLMLNGSKAEDILCVTFTTAGASVMKNRLRQVLSKWSVCDEKTLRSDLRKLTGRTATIAQCKRARQLFAEFLETPGGMKIQTIHAFAQSMIKRFPIETGIPPYFEVMDDQTSSGLLRDAQAEILNSVRAENDTPLSNAVKMITPEVGEEDFVALLGEVTYRRDQFNKIIRDHGGLEETIQSVYDYLGAERGTHSKMLRDQVCHENGLPNEEPPHVQALLEAASTMIEQGSKADRDKGVILQAFWETPAEERWTLYDDYLSVFLTTTGDPRKRLATKACLTAIPALEQEMERIQNGQEAIKTVNVANGTEALMILSDAVLVDYERRKRELNLLDYDDLIFYGNKLLEHKDDTAWALHKLGGNLSHILVDEAQDTNPEQWQIVASITREFFKPQRRTAANKNAKTAAKTNSRSRKKADKTMFVVGDEKQSIYSFQRADPQEFNNRKKMFTKQVEKAGGKWQQVDMEVAFRSSPAIMNAVDAVFKNPDASDGLTFDEDIEIRHDPFRRGQAGEVSIFPVLKFQEPAPLKPWALPLKMEEVSEPSMDLAEQIADKIKDMLDDQEKLPARKRSVNPGDFMVLVRRRSAFVDHLVRALKKRDVPVSGADRMSLREQVAVMDMVALGEFLLFPKDDYKLACFLKSPLVGMTDGDLEKIAIDRKEKTLWQSMEERVLEAREKNPDAEDDIFAKAYDYMQGLKESLDQERPYEFYSDVLMKPCPASENSGLHAMYGRLGFEAEDPIVEFMNALERFERNHTPSLQGALAWLEAGQAEVKRDVSEDQENPRVKIMTVHGAKGLESPIVILPDTTGIPADNIRSRPKLLWPNEDRKVPLWTPRAGLENKKFTEEREKLETERDREYRRLLYVAMTRAEDRLMVYGYQNKRERDPSSWYSLIERGMAENLPDITIRDPETMENPKEPHIEHIVAQTGKVQPDGVKNVVKKKRKTSVPLWARTEAREAKPEMEKFRPSDGAEKASNDNDAEKTVKSAPSPLWDKREKHQALVGTLVHELLEYLPNIPQEKWHETAKSYLDKPVWKISKDEKQQIHKAVLNVLEDPDFGFLFGPGSRAEVNIAGFVKKDGETQKISGQIDRLVVKDNTVWIVDYKNGRKIPKDETEISQNYLLQLGAYRQALKQIYPDKRIRCALLWTRTAKLQPVPAVLLDKTCRQAKLKPAFDMAKKTSTPASTPKPTRRIAGGRKSAAAKRQKRKNTPVVQPRSLKK